MDNRFAILLYTPSQPVHITWQNASVHLCMWLATCVETVNENHLPGLERDLKLQ